jgi:hypothetical protein
MDVPVVRGQHTGSGFRVMERPQHPFGNDRGAVGWQGFEQYGLRRVCTDDLKSSDFFETV